MSIIELPIVGPSYVDSSRNIAFEECINFYLEMNEPGGKSPAALRGTPGLDLYGKVDSTNDIAIRGLKTMVSTANLYAISGGLVYRVTNSITDTLTSTLIGSVNVGREGTNTQVIMADDGNQILATSGSINKYVGNGLAYKITNTTVAAITQLIALVTNPTHCAYIGGYWIVNDARTNSAFYSDQDSIDDWAALQTISFSPGKGNLRALTELNGELWMFGDEAMQVFYYDSTDADSPFSEIAGSQHNIGIAAIYSLATNDRNIFWMSSDAQGRGIVWTNEGYTPRKVSTQSIENAIAGYETIWDAVGYTYQQDGHYFYVLSFPTANATWVYDATTGVWHRRSYWKDGNHQRHRVQNAVFWNDKIVCGDWENSNLYYYNLETYTDNGDTIRSVRSSPHIHKNRERVFFKSFELDMETGVGLVTGHGSDPQVALQISDDGGHTWGNEKWLSMGKIGEYLKRIKWWRLGQSRNRIWRVIITDPVKRVLISAVADVE